MATASDDPQKDHSGPPVVHHSGHPKGEHFTDLFSDLSKSLTGGIRSLLDQRRGGGDAATSSSVEEPMSLTSLITGSNCLKTCGMEDIQQAARKASDLFDTVRVCSIVLTSLLALYIFLLIAFHLHKMNICKRKQQQFGPNMGQGVQKGRWENGAMLARLKSKLCSPPPPPPPNCNPIYSHPQLAQSDSSRSQETATVATTPMPTPPPNISHQSQNNGENGEATANFFFGTAESGSNNNNQQPPQLQHFDSLSEYLLAKRMVEVVGNGTHSK